MRPILHLVVPIFALAALLIAADLNGKWSGVLKAGNGDLDTAMVFKVEGEKLTGTVTNMYGEEQIMEGSMKGDEIAFIIIAGGGQFKLVYKGKVEKDQIRFRVTVGDLGESELIAKRS